MFNRHAVLNLRVSMDWTATFLLVWLALLSGQFPFSQPHHRCH